MKKCYIPKSFRKDALILIDHMEEIINDLQSQGFRLTVRQLYYQLVAKGIIPNTLQEYKRVAGVINDAKLAGLLDWEAIEDRTREFLRQTRWESGGHILRAAVSSFHKDMWDNQDHRIFVIVEKEALVGVLEPTCRKWDIPVLAARGYPSGTVLREFVESDLIDCLNAGQVPVILHLGDHDPSGIDMSRDLDERLGLFAAESIYLQRIALNMDQVEELRPPENPAKMTDSRFEEYKRKFGTKSWELDALSPAYLADLLEGFIYPYVDTAKWKEVEDQIEDTKRRIIKLSEQFAE